MWIIIKGITSAIVASPPSSPPTSSQASEPSSLPASPPSSPPPRESPLKKRRTWQVFTPQNSEGQKQPSKSTWHRWKTQGLVHAAGPSAEDSDAIVPPDAIVDVFQPLDGPDFASQQQTESDISSDLSDREGSASAGTSYVDSSSVHSDSSSDELPLTGSDSSVDDSDEVNSNSDDDFTEGIKLYDGCQYTVDEAVLDLVSGYQKNKETKKSLSDHLKFVYKYLPQPNHLPKSVYHLFKYVQDLAPMYKETAYPYCANCLLFCERDGPCEACESEETKLFYDFSVEDQIKFYFERCNLADILDKYRDRAGTCDKVRDICDGAMYRSVKRPGLYNITLMWNTDGVNISKSSNSSLWPVQYVICELPHHLRSCFMIVCGVWCDSAKPPMNTLLRPFAESMLKIHEKGGVEWVHPQTGVQHKSSVIAPLVCADAPVRAEIQNIKSHMSNHGCNTCEQKTARVPLTPAEREAKAAGLKVKHRRAFLFEEEPARLRDGQRMEKQARKAQVIKRSVKGVRGPSVVALVPSLDLGACVYAEYMHGVCLGVVRRFLSLWFTVRGPWNIAKEVDEINLFQENVKPTSSIGSLPRSISDFSKWKASECRSWLLVYSLPIVSQFLPQVHTQHWSLFVMAIYLLLKEEVSENDLAMSETMLKLFVRDVGNLYRQSDYVFNVHQLLHLPLYVKRWGPLWATSAFVFENYNGVLAGLIHGTKNPGKELVNSLRIAHGVEILKSKVTFSQTSAITSECEVMNQCNSVCLTQEEVAIITSNGFSWPGPIFSRARFRRELYTSKLYFREKKRNNYTIKFQSPSLSGYGEIKYFILKDDDVHAVVHVFKINHPLIFFHDVSMVKVDHIVPVLSSPDLIVINMKYVTAKLVRVGDFVCRLPNSIERNL